MWAYSGPLCISLLYGSSLPLCKRREILFCYLNLLLKRGGLLNGPLLTYRRQAKKASPTGRPGSASKCPVDPIEQEACLMGQTPDGSALSGFCSRKHEAEGSGGWGGWAARGGITGALQSRWMPSKRPSLVLSLSCPSSHSLTQTSLKMTFVVNPFVVLLRIIPVDCGLRGRNQPFFWVYFP